MAKGKSQVSDEPADSFTSMIDIVFLLLIFFILQPFKSPEKKLRSELPNEGISSEKPQLTPTIRLEIRPVAGKEEEALFKIGNASINSDALKTHPLWIANQLRRESNGDKTIPVTIAPWTAVRFEHVLRALDQCYIAEMSSVKWESPPVLALKNN